MHPIGSCISCTYQSTIPGSSWTRGEDSRSRGGSEGGKEDEIGRSCALLLRDQRNLCRTLPWWVTGNNPLTHSPSCIAVD